METAATNQVVGASGIKNVLSGIGTFGKITAGVGLLTAGAASLHRAYTSIQNDAQRKQLISDLHLNDPFLKEVPEEQLLEWYSTIYHFAPKFSLDKSAVREVLQNFARFGKVDVNTLKMLAETEKAMTSNTATWDKLFGNVSNFASVAAKF